MQVIGDMWERYLNLIEQEDMKDRCADLDTRWLKALLTSDTATPWTRSDYIATAAVAWS
jgi:hypothetical protein